MGSHSEEIQNCLWLQTWLDAKTEYLEASWSASPPHTLDSLGAFPPMASYMPAQPPH